MLNVLENLSVAHASDYLGVSIDTIRRWEKKGLVKAKRSENGHRLFSVTELERLNHKLSGGTGSGFHVLKAETPSHFSLVELFAGAGGLALGLENAGLKAKLLVDIDQNATATLQKNRPNWNIVCSDIAEVNFEGLEADIVTGGFPCQSFSYAGKRLGFEDIRGTLAEFKFEVQHGGYFG